MERTYLFVSPEDKPAVQALGARWDADSKRWYIDSAGTTAPFAQWLPAAEDAEDFDITSHQAYVAAATTHCQRCRAPIEVICIYCEHGTVNDDALTRFTVSDISSMDHALTRQLQPWSHFRRIRDSDGAGNFANHCAECGAPQEDMYLHSEPDQPFFDVPHAAPGHIELLPLSGQIQLCGDEHFAVD